MMEKQRMIRSKAIRQSARGQPCTVHAPGCTGDNETTVWAHSNLQLHGKGMGLKAHDIFGCYACVSCHAWLDQRKPDWRELFWGAFALSLIRLVEIGIIEVKS